MGMLRTAYDWLSGKKSVRAIVKYSTISVMISAAVSDGNRELRRYIDAENKRQDDYLVEARKTGAVIHDGLREMIELKSKGLSDTLTVLVGTVTYNSTVLAQTSQNVIELSREFNKRFHHEDGSEFNFRAPNSSAKDASASPTPQPARWASGQ